MDNSSPSNAYPKLHFESVSELLKRTPDEIDWLWDGFLAPGALTLLAGKPKVGKTYLLFGLLRSMAAGAPFLGRDTRADLPVFLTEENDASVKEKMRLFGLESLGGILLYGKAAELPWSEIARQSIDYALARGAQLLVIDTLPVWGGLSGNRENDTGALLELLRPLQVAAATHNLAVLILWHFRKGEGELIDLFRGGNALTGAVDIVVGIERASGSGESARELQTASRFHATPSNLVIELQDDNTYQVLGESATEAREQQHVEKIRAALNALGKPATCSEIAAETNIPENTLRRALPKLTDHFESSGSGTRPDPQRWANRPPSPPPTPLRGGGGENEAGGDDLPVTAAEHLSGSNGSGDHEPALGSSVGNVVEEIVEPSPDGAGAPATTDPERLERIREEHEAKVRRDFASWERGMARAIAAAPKPSVEKGGGDINF